MLNDDSMVSESSMDKRQAHNIEDYKLNRLLPYAHLQVQSVRGFNGRTEWADGKLDPFAGGSETQTR